MLTVSSYVNPSIEGDKAAIEAIGNYNFDRQAGNQKLQRAGEVDIVFIKDNYPSAIIRACGLVKPL